MTNILFGIGMFVILLIVLIASFKSLLKQMDFPPGIHNGHKRKAWLYFLLPYFSRHKSEEKRSIKGKNRRQQRILKALLLLFSTALVRLSKLLLGNLADCHSLHL